MNKFVKGFLIGAIVLVVLGMVVFFGGAAAGGISMASDVVKYTLHRYDIEDDGTDDFEDKMEDYIENETDLQENRTESEFAAGEVRNLEIDFSRAAVMLVEGTDTDKITVSAKHQCAGAQMQGNLLKIRSLSKCRDEEKEEIVITVPADFHFDEVDISVNASALEIASINARSLEIETGAGKVEIDQMKAEEADFGVGAGEIVVHNGDVRSCDVEVGSGCFVYEGIVYDGNGYAECSVECNMGTAEFVLQGKAEDYNYELECATGSIIIGDETFGGLSGEKLIDHQARADFEIDCSMGEVKVVF